MTPMNSIVVYHSGKNLYLFSLITTQRKEANYSNTMMAFSSSSSTGSSGKIDPTATPLKRMYQATTFLSIMMVVWILLLPGSWLLGRSTTHNEIFHVIFVETLKDGIVPTDVLTKYRGHTLVHFTHIVPAAIWSACIPFQLHSGFRKKYPSVHRFMGYTFLTSSLLVTIGIFVILKRDLYFEKFYPDLPPLPVTTEPMMFINATCFAGCALMSLNLARQRRFFYHQLWIIRHIAFGLWVAVQRFLLTVAVPLFPPPVPRDVQRRAFISCAFVGMIICHICSEYSIYLLKKQRDFAMKVQKEI